MMLFSLQMYRCILFILHLCKAFAFFFNINDEVNVTNSLPRFANDASVKSKALLRISKLKRFCHPLMVIDP